MSDWKKGAADRRDERNVKAPELTKKPSSKRKNKKKWCRGKEGVEHKPKCVLYHSVKHTNQSFGNNWKILICTECGKELEYYYPMNWGGKEKPKPPWVT